jgi:cob(I)alamin adenosyltransferase
MERGLVHIYTGDGKGKTSAAVGLAVRARARGMKVLFAQFMKKSRGNELDLLEKLSVKVVQYNEVLSPYFHPEADKEEQKEKIERALNEVRRIMGEFDLAVLDEFLHLVRLGLFSEGKAIHLIREKPKKLELVLTGRGATKRLIEAAQYVTEMKEIKHPLREGIRKAKEGIEY